MRPTDERSGVADADKSALIAAMAAAKETPAEVSCWERVEALAAQLDTPEEAVRLYGDVLQSELASELVVSLGERAARFHDEWFGTESDGLAGVLQRVVEVDIQADWAFERLTHLYTVAENWGPLLALYDRAIDHAASKSRRGSLLEEAADLAKDLAGDSDRAIGYLQQLTELKPRNKQVAVTLERLLDRHERWADLIELWTQRLSVLSGKAGAATREQIAACWLDRRHEPEQALTAIVALLETGADDTEACRLLEKIVRDAATPTVTRDRALEVLQARYEEANRERDLVSVVQAAIEFADEERARQLRELAGHILGTLGESTGSFDQFAAVFVQDPSDTAAQEELRHLAHEANSFEPYAVVLERAAEACEAPARAIALRAEAARIRSEHSDHRESAVDTYQRALLTDGAAASAVLQVCGQLDALLAELGRDADRLAVLERRAAVEPTDQGRREALAELAEVAERLGQLDRAAAAWTARLEGDFANLAALTALARVHEACENWQKLVAVLRLRADAQVEPQQRRADLMRIAELRRTRLDDTTGAAEVLRELHKVVGPTAASVDCLAEVLEETQQWAECEELLGQAIARGGARRAELLGRVGELYRLHLQEPSLAVIAYRDALAVDCDHAASRAGLTALLEHDSARPAALTALGALYARTGEWERELELVDARVSECDELADKVEALRSAAVAVERRSSDGAPRAFEFVVKALALAPADVGLAGELIRLGGVTDRWTEVRDGLRVAAEAAEPAAAAALRVREGRVCERELQDSEAALGAYQLASQARPDDVELAVTVARLAGVCQHWAAASGAVVVAVAREPQRLAPLLAELRAVAEPQDALRAVTDAVIAAVGSAEVGAAPGALPARCASEMEGIIAGWLRDQLDAPAEAIAALQRASAHNPSDANLVTELAALQRGTRDVALFDTLSKLAAAANDDLDALHEAAQLATSELDDADRATATVESLLARADRLQRVGMAATGERQPAEVARWAVDQLLERYRQADNPRRALAIALEAISWEQDADRKHGLRKRAAELCVALQEPQRAIAIYRDLISATPTDTESLGRLGELCRAEGDVVGVLTARRAQLVLTEEPEQQLGLRLEIAELVGELERTGRRVETLLENLSQAPGHLATVQALSQVLGERSRFGELADVLTQQAHAVAEQGDATSAGSLWLRTALVCERELGDTERAIQAQTKAVAAAPDAVDALDGLARLNAAKGEHAEAITWLERLLGCAPAEQQHKVRLRLARALVDAGHAERAVERLEEAGDARQSDPELRTLLAELYRTSEAWNPLARLLTDALAHISDDAEAMVVAREAATLYREQLGTPERAIAALRRAQELQPSDLVVRQQLAESLRVAGDLHEARELLEQMLSEFGRRRSRERADAHRELARVAKAQGNVDEALSHLDEATSMDPGNTASLAALAELARGAGQLDRAERAYRALLLAVRRSDDTDEAALGECEVLFELHYLAAERGDRERAVELRQSAVEAALESDDAVRCARRALLAHEDPDGLRDVLEQRLELVDDELARAQILSYLAEAFTQLGQADDALETSLEALRCAPDRVDLHDVARAAASASSAMTEYLDAVRDLAARARRKDDSVRVSALQLQLGITLEREQNDLDAAAEAYKRAADSGVGSADAYSALARVSAARGDAEAQAEALDQLLKLADEAPPATRADALYELAEVRAPSAEWHAQAMERLEVALSVDPRYGRAGAILRTALEAMPESAAALALYERVARRANDGEMLLDYLERCARTDQADLAVVREGVELAVGLELSERAEALIDRAMLVARDSAGGLSEHLWAPKKLIQLRRSAGRLSEAAELIIETMAVAGTEPLWGVAVEVVQQARQDGVWAVARELLDLLRAHKPGAREVWEPLFYLLADAGDYDAVEQLAQATALSLVEVADRNEMRMLFGSLLERDSDRRRAAFEVYKDVLLDQPGHTDALARIEDLLQELGTQDEIVAFLTQQFSDAADRRDAEAAGALALRLRQRLRDSDPDEAANVLRTAIGIDKDNAELIRALIDQLGAEGSPGELAELKERLLGLSEGDVAAGLALELHELRLAAGDQSGARAALERGYQIAPEHDGIRQRLERWYRDNELHRELVGLLTSEAKRLAEPDRVVPMLTEAAAISRDLLVDHAAANDALRLAAELAPNNIEVLSELVRTLASSGAGDEAVGELERALERGIDAVSDRVTVMLMLADARSGRSELAGAVQQLELANELAPERASGALDEALAALRDQAASAGDTAAERSATLRIAQRARAAGRDDACREALEHWLSREPDDREVLYELRDLHAGANRPDEVVAICAKLVYLEEGDDQLEVARQLALASGHAGDPTRARLALETAYADYPEDEKIGAALRTIYERCGAHRELAAFVLKDADRAQEEVEVLELLLRAADLLLQTETPVEALPALERARNLQPENRSVALRFIDASIATGQLEEARAALDPMAKAMRRSRGKDAAQVLRRVARLERASGELDAAAKSLERAFEFDRNDGFLAAELARTSIERKAYAVAIKALRTISLKRLDGPITPEQALIEEGRIELLRSNNAKAEMLAKKVLRENPNSEVARELLESAKR